VLEARAVSKSFGTTLALREVSLAFAPGEIHAVIGENGAGKSTLMNLLSGLLRPSAGGLFVDGDAVNFKSPADARAQGIEMVHQHFMLVPNLSVRENLELSQLQSSGLVISGQASLGLLGKAKQLGWEFDPEQPVRDLSVGQQQRLEITKCLTASARYIILDEPTAVLITQEVEGLFTVLRGLRDQGLGVILIAHKLSEVLGIADRISVLRGGQFVGTVARADADEKTLQEWMLGSVSEAQKTYKSYTTYSTFLKAENLTFGRALRGVSFEIKAGEILGFGGVDGNGQTELAEVLTGVVRPDSGEINWTGTTGYVPPDRQRDGLAMTMSLTENLLIGAPFSAPKNQKLTAQDKLVQFSVKSDGPDAMASSLSGGNQQKVVLARVLSQKPELLVVVNPTRGLDFGATEFVRQRIAQAAANGAAVALFSTDPDELAELATQTVYLSRGELKATLEEAVR